jgi:serine phosphatase RsbU (regulator of sigma subunit)
LVNIIFLFSFKEAIGLFVVTCISYIIFLPINDLPILVLLGSGGFSTFCISIMMLFVNITMNRIKTNESRSLVLLEYKNREIEQKNKDITDSIQYARKIQDVILPTDAQFQKIFSENFILYKPKDIVSGDFYWVAEWGNKKILAVADCTGHGVPGAFMSIMNSNFLSQSVNELGIDKPALILNDIKKNIIKKFQKDSNAYNLRDGMDVSLIAINKINNLVEFAGAYNPLWVVREDKFIEIKADKMSISADPLYAQKSFENQAFQAQKGDILYLFTDGYADQFGGPKSKKFKYSQLKELLLKISKFSMEEQKSLLNNEIERWKGSLEQVDDILIIGIRI